MPHNFKSPSRAHAARFTRYGNYLLRWIDYNTAQTLQVLHSFRFDEHQSGLVSGGSAMFVLMANSFSERDRILAQVGILAGTGQWLASSLASLVARRDI